MQSKAIGFEIRTVNNLLKRKFEKNLPKELVSSVGVHGWAIKYFYANRDKEIFQKDFEANFSIRRSTATKILQNMEKNGFIERKSVERDARLKRIVLTEKAIEIHQKVHKALEQTEKNLKVGISNDELENFYNVCEKIKKNLEESND